MGESIVQVTEGSGKKLHTWQRTIGANNVEDEYVIQGEQALATYSVVAAGVATATAASHLMQVMAGASLNVRIRRIRVSQNAAAGSVSVFPLQIVRVTTAGTGGTAVTPGKFDNGDAAAGATGMTLPTAKGTEGTILWDESIWLATGAIPTRQIFEVIHLPASKPFIIPAGTTNGIVLKNTTGIATSTLDITVEIVETSFL